MAKKIVAARAIVILIDTVGPRGVVKKGDVLLVPEEISEDTARDLMRMGNPRAKNADESQTKKRVLEYNKEVAERKEKEAAERKLAEEAAQAELDELAKLQQEVVAEADAKAVEIIKTAEEKAAEIIKAADTKAEEIIKAAEQKAGAKK